MRIVIAPDKFKSCLSAAEVAEALAAGALAADPRAEIDICPMADGGEGTVDALVAATGGRFVTRTVTGPLPEMRVEARFGMLGDRQTAVIEMSAASGLPLLPPEQRNPMHTTTFGTGELLKAAIDIGATHIILGIGGSATTDGGIGCAQACGTVFEMEDGSTRGPADHPLCGRDVSRVTRMQGGHSQDACATTRDGAYRSTGFQPVEEHKPVAPVTILVACDVTNPLFGSNGAACIYGPQKGATPEQVRLLDDALRQLATRLNRLDLADHPGAGAAGGLGFGMMAFFGATLRSGIDIVIEAANLRQRLLGADLCITGEGRFDTQSLSGKTPVGIARLCNAMSIPCAAVAGAVEPSAREPAMKMLQSVLSIGDLARGGENTFTNARELLARAAEKLVRGVTEGRGMPQRDTASP